VVVLVGGILSASRLPAQAIWFVPLLFLVIRPVSVWLGLIGSRSSADQRRLIAWFGIRGIGSVYYLAFAAQHGLDPALAEQIAGLALSAVAASVVVHGISVTPLMRRYQRQQAEPRRERESAAEG
jgi:NhaP-type Na+/H+ or K+/H+ antiporter